MVIEGFRLYEPKGQVVASVKQLRIQSGLWGAIGSHLGQVTLESPRSRLWQGPTGSRPGDDRRLRLAARKNRQSLFG